jgi:hypothetical protein
MTDPKKSDQAEGLQPTAKNDSTAETKQATVVADEGTLHPGLGGRYVSVGGGKVVPAPD